MQQLPIGIFDSGIGGISVLNHAMQEMPTENFIFYGDSANAPYGEKSENEIASLSIACGDFLCQKGVKMLVMACNTATSASVWQLRDKYNIPIVSIEPAVKPALKNDGKVLVLATPATISQNRYNLLLDKIGQRERVINVPCEGLAKLIEEGDFTSFEIYDYIEKKLTPHANYGVTSVVLGCTHYSYISDVIESIGTRVFNKCEIHNGMYGMIRQVKRLLKQYDLENRNGGNIELFSSGSESNIKRYFDILEKLQCTR